MVVDRSTPVAALLQSTLAWLNTLLAVWSHNLPSSGVHCYEYLFRIFCDIPTNDGTDGAILFLMHATEAGMKMHRKLLI